MTTPPPRRVRAPFAWAWAAVALALPAALAVLPALMLDGGLAPLAVAGVVALLLGAPTAEGLWAGATDHDDDAARAVWRTAVAVTAGAALAEGLSTLDAVLAIAVAVAVWTLGATRAGRITDPVRPLYAAIALVVGVGFLLQPLATFGSETLVGTPWSGLEPRWDTWRSWAPPAVSVGLLMALGAPGHWSVASRRQLGTPRMPWTVTGLALLLVTGAAAVHALTFEVVPSPLDPWLTGLAAPVALIAVLASIATTAERDLRPMPDVWVGLAFTAWWLGPGASARQWWWTGLLPLVLAASLVWAARTGRTRRPIAAYVSAGLAVAAVAAGLPPVPELLAPAVAGAAALVAFVWVSGTRAAVRSIA